MSKRIIIYPYKMGSQSAKRLAESLETFRVFPNRDYKPQRDDVVINWGNGVEPRWDGSGFTFLNRPESVMNAINKIVSMRRFREGGVNIPEYTTSINSASEWLQKGYWAVCRQETEGLDGSGLVLAKTANELVRAKLYTKFVRSSHEFRVYVFAGRCICILEKRRKRGLKADPNIRTGGNNWVLCQDPEIVPKDLAIQSALAVESLGLDFGGVDVIYSDKEDKSYCLEVNTAPDIRNTTVSAFKEAILEFIAR